jgi:hypothetical protein
VLASNGLVHHAMMGVLGTNHATTPIG